MNEFNKNLIKYYGSELKWVPEVSSNVDWIREIWNTYGSVYVADGKWKIHHYADSIYFSDISDAFKTGKTVFSYIFRAGWTELLKLIPENFEYSNTREFIDGLIAAGVEFGVREEKSVNYFNPSNLKNLKPVDKLPKRPTAKHIVRLIANGQYTVLKQNYHYTDDYTYDAAVNFKKNNNVNPLKMIEDILFMNNRTWTNVVDGFVSINFGAHSNDSKTIVTTVKAA